MPITTRTAITPKLGIPPPPVGNDGNPDIPDPPPDDDGGRGEPPPELLGRGAELLGFLRLGALARSRCPSLVVRRRRSVFTIRFFVIFPRVRVRR